MSTITPPFSLPPYQMQGMVDPSRSQPSPSSSSLSPLTSANAQEKTVQTYHASLSNHLSSILSSSLDSQTRPHLLPKEYSRQLRRSPLPVSFPLANAPTDMIATTTTLSQPPTQQPSVPRKKDRMYTDLKALAERDKEHMTAWCLEGYRRYMGGVNPGFQLGNVPRGRGNAEVGEDGTGVEQNELGLGKRKRRYTEEPGLLERRRKVLKAMVKGGGSEIISTDDDSISHPQSNKRRRSGSVDSPRTQKGDPLAENKEKALDMDDLNFRISPLITPGLAFLPSPFEQVENKGMDFSQAIGTGVRVNKMFGTGFQLKQPPMNRGMMRRTSNAFTMSKMDSPHSTRGRHSVSSHSAHTSRSSGSIAHISAIHLPISLPSPSSQGTPRHEHPAEAVAFASSSSAGLTSLTGASMACYLAKSHEGLTGSSSGLMAGGGLVMTGMETPVGGRTVHFGSDVKESPCRSEPGAWSEKGKGRSDEQEFAVANVFTPGLTPSFGLGGEMLLSMGDDPTEAVEVVQNRRTMEGYSEGYQPMTPGGLGLTGEPKRRPTLLQRATSSFMPNKYGMDSPATETGTPMEVLWDRWLSAEDSPAAEGKGETGRS